MSAAVVDASVGVKRFVPEILAAEARRWRHGPDDLHVPAFFFEALDGTRHFTKQGPHFDWPFGVLSAALDQGGS